MSTRAAAWLAWALCVLSLALTALRGCADRRVANVSMGDEEPT
jgi:hypothetical protein